MFGIFKKVPSVNFGVGLPGGYQPTYLWFGSLADAERRPALWRLTGGPEGMPHLALEEDFFAEAELAQGAEQILLAEPEQEFLPFKPERILLLSAGMESKVRTLPREAARLALVTPLPVRKQQAWKLTLLDSDRDKFMVGTAVLEEGVLSIPYRYAAIYHPVNAPNERISAIVTDKSRLEIKYYGNIALPVKNRGEAQLDIKSVNWAEGDRLFVFSEQCNGYMRTDFASPLLEIPLTRGVKEF